MLYAKYMNVNNISIFVRVLKHCLLNGSHVIFFLPPQDSGL